MYFSFGVIHHSTNFAETHVQWIFTLIVNWQILHPQAMVEKWWTISRVMTFPRSYFVQIVPQDFGKLVTIGIVQFAIWWTFTYPLKFSFNHTILYHITFFRMFFFKEWLDSGSLFCEFAHFHFDLGSIWRFGAKTWLKTRQNCCDESGHVRLRSHGMWLFCWELLCFERCGHLLTYFFGGVGVMEI